MELDFNICKNMLEAGQHSLVQHSTATTSQVVFFFNCDNLNWKRKLASSWKIITKKYHSL